MTVTQLPSVRQDLLQRLHDDMARLDARRLADLVANPVKPRIIAKMGAEPIRPVRNRGPRVLRATVADPFHSGTTPHVTDEGTSLSNDRTTGVGFNGDLTATGLTVCDCGMGYIGSPHPCMKWHYKMLTAEAKKDFTEVVKKHCGGYIPNPALSLDLQNADTQAYIARAVNPPFRNNLTRQDVQPVLVRFVPDVLDKLLTFRTDDGKKVSLTFGKPGPYGVTEFTMTVEDDPDWVKSFTKKHEEKKSAMPICCTNPDPRIAKSGRPYCHSCKKYLDRVPPPQEQVVVKRTITEEVTTGEKK